MPDENDRSDGPVRRGQAVFLEAKENVAERNAKARKAGREQRQAYEQEQAKARRVRERLEFEALKGKHKG
jgi:hypothetical protein